jgi:hypothetical protein
VEEMSGEDGKLRDAMWKLLERVNGGALLAGKYDRRWKMNPDRLPKKISKNSFFFFFFGKSFGD